MPLTDPKDVEVEPLDDREEAIHPATYLQVDLSEAERKDLEAWLFLHLTQIAADMAPILTRFQQEVDQLEGNMPGGDYPYAGAFRVNYPLTRKKVREVANRIKQAYLDSDPVWGIDLDDPHMFELAIKLEKALDTAIDHDLDEEDDLSLAIFEATAHGIGALIPTWLYHEERVRQLETWEGFDGQTVESLQDMIAFEAKYPNWRDEKELVTLHAQLRKGTRIEREVSATVPVANHPDFQHVEAKRLRVYPHVEGYEGLRSTPLYGYVTTYTRFQLEQLAEQDVIDRDALGRLLGDVTGQGPDDADDAEAQTEEFEVFQGTMRYRLGADEVPTRYKVWYAVKEQVVLRTRFYPWWYHEADLIPFYVRLEDPGFFKRGVAADVVDEHTVLNVLLNLYLNAIDLANSMRWKAKYRSLGYAHLLSKRWSPHLPAPWKDNPNEIESLATPTNHLPPILNGFQLMLRQSDESTGTSSLQSGRESPTDPSAPASKTIALLQQVQPNEKDILRSLSPAFRQMGVWTMWLYFQGLKLKWITELPGGLQIAPDLLPELAKHLHPRAILFDFDRQGRFERSTGILAMTQKILGATRPDVILKMLRIAIQQADPTWARLVDTLDLERPAPLPMVPPGEEGADAAAPPSGNGFGGADPAEALMQRMGAQVGNGAA